MIVEYCFAGRSTWRELEPTEILETESWKKVWSENSLNIGSVCLSPDGKKMAFVRDGVLEIGPFVETAGEH
ncbi:MAG: hypothetical protein ACYTG0_08625 [Planctomycetota bacterium]